MQMDLLSANKCCESQKTKFHESTNCYYPILPKTHRSHGNMQHSLPVRIKLLIVLIIWGGELRQVSNKSSTSTVRAGKDVVFLLCRSC